MFPTSAVNQILLEPLCKSVHACAKFPHARDSYLNWGGWVRLLNCARGLRSTFKEVLEILQPSFLPLGSMLVAFPSKLLVLWDREIRSHSGFCHHYVTSHLPHDLPARFAEGVRRFLAGNVAEPPHPLSRQLPSNRDDHRRAIRPQRLHPLLILGP